MRPQPICWDHRPHPYSWGGLAFALGGLAQLTFFFDVVDHSGRVAADLRGALLFWLALVAIFLFIEAWRNLYLAGYTLIFAAGLYGALFGAEALLHGASTRTQTGLLAAIVVGLIGVLLAGVAWAAAGAEGDPLRLRHPDEAIFSVGGVEFALTAQLDPGAETISLALDAQNNWDTQRRLKITARRHPGRCPAQASTAPTTSWVELPPVGAVLHWVLLWQGTEAPGRYTLELRLEVEGRRGRRVRHRRAKGALSRLAWVLSGRLGSGGLFDGVHHIEFDTAGLEPSEGVPTSPFASYQGMVSGVSPETQA